MRLIRLSATLTMLLTSVACAQTSTGGGPDTPSPKIVSTNVPPPSALPASELPAAMRPNVVRPDSRATDLKPVRWTRVEAAPGRQIQVHYTITGRADCAALGRVTVVETARTVTVTVLLGRLPGADCGGTRSQLAASLTTLVTLNEPLGGRVVRDGAVG